MKNMTLSLFVAVSAVLFSSVYCCTCPPTTIEDSYSKPENRFFVKAIPKYERVFNNRRIYSLQILKQYKSCITVQSILVSTPLQSATCGVKLEIGTEYVMPLERPNFPSINSCQFIRKYSSLTAQEKQFLNSRQICCKGKCTTTCPNNEPIVNCFRPPCSPPEKPPCPEATVCVDDYCGGCFARWFTSDGDKACES